MLENKKLVLFIVIIVFIFLLFQLTDVDAFICSVKDNCANNENLIFYMYNNVDTHVSKTNSNWPKKLCCTELVDSCTGLSTQLVKLYLSNDGHVSLNNVNYPQQVCLSVYGAIAGQGNITCEPKSSCASDEQCILTLSSNDDAHVSACNVAGSYQNKLCCKATPCPKDFRWNALLNNGKGGCEPAFTACYVGDIGSLSSDSGYSCKDKWRAPIKQSDPYWRDAVNSNTLDCFDSRGGVNAFACCPLTPTSVFDNKEYGKFTDVIVKKLTI